MAALIAAAGCSPTPNEAATNESSPVASNTAATPPVLSNGLEGEDYPTAQPGGSPLAADYCGEVTDKPGNPFDNTKTCLMIACDTGDKESCDLMQTYNGNLWPDEEPPQGDTRFD